MSGKIRWRLLTLGIFMILSGSLLKTLSASPLTPPSSVPASGVVSESKSFEIPVGYLLLSETDFQEIVDEAILQAIKAVVIEKDGEIAKLEMEKKEYASLADSEHRKARFYMIAAISGLIAAVVGVLF